MVVAVMPWTAPDDPEPDGAAVVALVALPPLVVLLPLDFELLPQAATTQAATVVTATALKNECRMLIVSSPPRMLWSGLYGAP
jgi:hypothetical protein